MTPLAIVARIKEHGGDLKLLPDGESFSIERRSRIPDEVAAEAKAHAAELRDFLKEQNGVFASTASAKSATIAKSATSVNEKWGSLNAAALARQAQRCGIRLFLDGSHLRIDASDAHEIPDDLLDTITAKAGSVIRFLHKAEAQADLEQRFGPLSQRGRLCRACLTIDLTRQTVKGEWCDDCILADARAVVATATAQGMLGGTA